MDEIEGQTGLFNIGMVTSQGGGKLSCTALKNDLVSHPVHGVVVG